ncbi:hypothetical protein C4B60_20305, partial [Jeotgalibacillus proteolyticus]
KVEDVSEGGPERAAHVRSRVSEADEEIRRVSEAAASADGRWGFPCESRTSLGLEAAASADGTQ